MKVQVYQLDCLTNMHMGDGEANYNIIDNQVQRDVVLNVPTIHSSGVKGSLKNYAQENGYTETELRELFGHEDGKGKIKYFTGNLITRPLRISCGEGGYVNATCRKIVENEVQFLNAMGLMEQTKLDLPESVPGTIIGSDVLGVGIQVEEMNVKTAASSSFPILAQLAGERWAWLADDDFDSFELPVQARNRLENGISRALWYEEIVPHKSRFYITVMEEIGETGLKLLESMIDGKVLQFGANASIGYGYCKVTKVDCL